MTLRAALVATLALASCAAPDGPFTCQSTTNCGDLGSVLTCCTDAHCEYRVSGGDTFRCQGIDCSAAHVALALYCAPHCPDASMAPDAWIAPDADADAGAASSDASLDGGGALDAQPCVR